jgi:hypothetical protein
MDPKLLLVKSITLLYREGTLEDATENSAALVKSIISAMRLPELTMDTDPGRAQITALKTTALWMCENPPGHRYDRSILLQRIRVNVGDDEGLYLAFLSGIDESTDVDGIKRSCVEHRNALRSFQDQSRVKDILKRASAKAMFSEHEIDWTSFVQDITLELEPFMGGIAEVSREGVVNDVNFDDPIKLAELFQAAKDDISSDGVLRCGWQGVNDMTGQHQGFRRGEFVVVAALPYNFKTGFTLGTFRQLCMYNKPYMLNPNKKPLMIRITTEDSLSDNLVAMYSQLKENETGIRCDLATLNTPEAIEEAARYVMDKLQSTGYHVYMARWDPTDVTYNKIFDLVTYYESQGYEIHGFEFDYLNMISKKGCTNNGVTGSEVRDLFRRVRNFMSA